MYLHDAGRREIGFAPRVDEAGPLVGLEPSSAASRRNPHAQARYQFLWTRSRGATVYRRARVRSAHLARAIGSCLCVGIDHPISYQRPSTRPFLIARRDGFPSHDGGAPIGRAVCSCGPAKPDRGSRGACPLGAASWEVYPQLLTAHYVYVPVTPPSSYVMQIWEQQKLSGRLQLNSFFDNCEEWSVGARDNLLVLDQRIETLRQLRAFVAGSEKEAARRRDTRRKIILGAKLLAKRKTDPRATALVEEMLQELRDTEKEAFIDWSP